MQRTVVFIMGTSFSGSSLLNSLFDSQPNTRGLGEAVHLIHKPTNAWCGHCKCHVDQCQLQKRICPDRFYESVFDVYPESEVVVNSSKHWGQCFRSMPIPASEFRLCLIILSKSLEEFSHSFAVHQTCSFENAFDVWSSFYQQLFANLDGVLTRVPKTDVQQRLVSRMTDDSIAYVSYRELATDTDATLGRLSDQLHLPFDSDYRNRLWGGDTCNIGGNNAIYAQRSGNAAFFQRDREYLNGKYCGRQGSIFYDDAWTQNDQLRAAARRYRESKQSDLESIERRLRHLPQPKLATTLIR